MRASFILGAGLLLGGAWSPRLALAQDSTRTIPAVPSVPQAAYETETVAGRVGGCVVAVDGTPVGGARIHVRGTMWEATTRTNGCFALDLPAGTWVLLIRHLGFRPVEVTVTARDVDQEGGNSIPSPIPGALGTFVLREAPLQLRGIAVQGAQTPALAQTVTRETVRQAPPLGEPDIFRAVALLPGVSQPNDLKGRIHLAGGSSDETGVRLDGHPLQDPFHLLGVLGAFNVAALERADVRVLHVPVEAEGHLSGVIDLVSRDVGPEPTYEATIGILSSSLTVTRPATLLGANVLVSGRLTYLDRLLRSLAGNGWIGADDVTLIGYRDGLAKVQRRWQTHASSPALDAELLAFTTRDTKRASSPVDGAPSPPLTWGEDLLGARLVWTHNQWTVTGRGSLNRALVRQQQAAESWTTGVDIAQRWWSAGLEGTRILERWRATVGLNADRRDHSHAWNGLVSGGWPGVPFAFADRTTQQLVAGYGELRWTDAVQWVSVGGRATTTDEAVHPAWRLAAGRRLPGHVVVEAALDRRYQFDAEPGEPLEGSASPPSFLLTSPRQVDAVGLSLAWQAGDGDSGQPSDTDVQLRAIGFGKRYRDRAVVQPALAPDNGTGSEPGVTNSFPTFLRAPGHSMGTSLSGDLSLRGRTRLQGSYTFQRTFESVGGQSSPTAWDAPHALTLFGSQALGCGWVANAAWQSRSGAAVTPVVARVFVPDPSSPELANARYILGDRNSARLPGFHRLDVGVRREWSTRRAEWALGLQVLNALSRSNPIEYDWSGFFCEAAGDCRGRSTARSGLPIVPSLTLEVRW